MIWKNGEDYEYWMCYEILVCFRNRFYKNGELAIKGICLAVCREKKEENLLLCSKFRELLGETMGL